MFPIAILAVPLIAWLESGLAPATMFTIKAMKIQFSMKAMYHRLQKIIRRMRRIYEIGCWLHMSIERRDSEDQSKGWMPPTDNNF